MLKLKKNIFCRLTSEILLSNHDFIVCSSYSFFANLEIQSLSASTHNSCQGSWSVLLGVLLSMGPQSKKYLFTGSVIALIRLIDSFFFPGNLFLLNKLCDKIQKHKQNDFLKNRNNFLPICLTAETTLYLLTLGRSLMQSQGPLCKLFAFGSDMFLLDSIDFQDHYC